MSVDYEGYDPNQVIEEADARRAEHTNNAKLLGQSAYILELVARQLSTAAGMAEFHSFEISRIVVDPKELMDIVGERANPREAAERIKLGSRTVFEARDFEAGRARAAKETADFVQSRLDDDAAAEDAAARVENS